MRFQMDGIGVVVGFFSFLLKRNRVLLNVYFYSFIKKQISVEFNTALFFFGHIEIGQQKEMDKQQNWRRNCHSKKMNENFNKFIYQIGWVTRPLFPRSSDLHSLYKWTLFLSRQFLFRFHSLDSADWLDFQTKMCFSFKFLEFKKKTDKKLNFLMQCNCRWTMWFTHSLSPSLCFGRLCFYGGTVCTP